MVLLLALGVLFLLRVVLPQADGATAEWHAQLVARSATARFFLVTLGLGDIATSRVFGVTLALFFLNLAGVLLERTGTTLRRIRFRPPAPDVARSLATGAAALRVGRPAGFTAAWPATVLRRLGYRVTNPDERSAWGVKHRTAPVGFLLFHASFFILCAGAVLLYFTRSVATLAAAEGQATDTSRAQLVRRAPWGTPPPFGFTVERVDVEVEAGLPVHLSARLRPDDPGLPALTSRVNGPATWGALSLLVERAGLAPVLWLQDSRGFTLDRVAVITSTEKAEPTRVPLAGGAFEVFVEPIAVGPSFPERGALATTALAVRVERGGRTVYTGPLAPGRIVPVGDRFLQLAELRYWVGVRMVHERGGPLLIAGFVLAVVGLVWRLLWYRREVAIVWDEESVSIGGRGELFPARFGEELEAIRDVLVTQGPRGQPARDTETTGAEP
jgi:hypothetical protein